MECHQSFQHSWHSKLWSNHHLQWRKRTTFPNQNTSNSSPTYVFITHCWISLLQRTKIMRHYCLLQCFIVCFSLCFFSISSTLIVHTMEQKWLLKKVNIFPSFCQVFDSSKQGQIQGFGTLLEFPCCFQKSLVDSHTL